MTFFYIGKVKNVEIYRDLEYQFFNNDYIVTVDKNVGTIEIKGLGKILTVSPDISMQSIQITQVREKMWVVRFPQNFLVLNTLNRKSLLIECKDIHITEHGIYIVSETKCSFMNFNEEAGTNSLIKKNFETFHFYKNFILVRSENFYNVFINLKNLPNGVAQENIPNLPFYAETNTKITVNFKNGKKDLDLSEILNFHSDFIEQQLKSGGEIF